MLHRYDFIGKKGKISYEIDSEKKLILEKVEGYITLNDGVEYNKNKFNDLEFAKTIRGVLDLRGATLNLSTDDIELFKDHYRENKDKIIPKRWAILCDSPLETAYINILCEVWNEIGLDVGVFSTDEVAREFLLL